MFCDSSSHHGGSRSDVLHKRSGKHVTCLMAACASGRVCPPFFIVQGTSVRSGWFSTLCADAFPGASAPFLTAPKKQNRIGDGTTVVCMSRGSMDMEVLPRFIEHLNRFVRQFVDENDHFLLKLDNHGSRKRFEWIEQCVRVTFEAVLAPANTSHFLQPCDQQINKRFQNEIGLTRDNLARYRALDIRSFGIRLMLAVQVHAKISQRDCSSSFAKTGLFSFQRNFADCFKVPVITIVDDHNEDETAPTTTPVHLERKTILQAQEILPSGEADERILQRLEIRLQHRESNNSILMSHRPASNSSSVQTKVSSNVAILSGTGAEYVTALGGSESQRRKDGQKAAEKVAKEFAKEAKIAAREAELLKKQETNRIKEIEKATKALAKIKVAEEKAERAAERKRLADEKRRAIAARKLANSDRSGKRIVQRVMLESQKRDLG